MDTTAGRRKELRRLFVCVGVGGAAGILSGLLGVGGGLVIVPGLLVGLRIDRHVAHGTSLAAVVPIAAFGAIAYGSKGALDWPAAVPLGIGACLGTMIGAEALARARVGLLRVAFGFVLIASAVPMLAVLRLGEGSDADAKMAFGLLVVGLVSGGVAGLLGVGAGTLMVPAMAVGFGIPIDVAKGTSLLVLVPAAALGTFRNGVNGNMDVPPAIVTGLAGAITAGISARLSLRLDPAISMRLVGAFLLILALWILASEGYRRVRSTPTASGG